MEDVIRNYPVVLQLSQGCKILFTQRNLGKVLVGCDAYKKGFMSARWISAEDGIMYTEVNDVDYTESDVKDLDEVLSRL